MNIGSLSEWTAIAEQQSGNTEAASDGCIATFYTHPVQNKHKSRIEDRPIFDPVPYVKIVSPGDNKSVVDREVQDADKKRWPNAWRRFEAEEEGTLDGTPLEEWGYLTVTQRAEYRHVGMRTVEQLANLSDDMVAKIGPGAREIRERAAQYLKPQDDVVTDLRSQIADKDRQIADLEGQLSEALRQLNAKPRRGRPPKEAA